MIEVINGPNAEISLALMKLTISGGLTGFEILSEANRICLKGEAIFICEPHRVTIDAPKLCPLFLKMVRVLISKVPVYLIVDSERIEVIETGETEDLKYMFNLESGPEILSEVFKYDFALNFLKNKSAILQSNKIHPLVLLLVYRHCEGGLYYSSDKLLAMPASGRIQ